VPDFKFLLNMTNYGMRFAHLNNNEVRYNSISTEGGPMRKFLPLSIFLTFSMASSADTIFTLKSQACSDPDKTVSTLSSEKKVVVSSDKSELTVEDGDGSKTTYQLTQAGKNKLIASPKESSVDPNYFFVQIDQDSSKILLFDNQNSDCDGGIVISTLTKLSVGATSSEVVL